MTAKPTFMRIRRFDEETSIMHTVDRRPVAATDWWNFWFESFSVAEEGDGEEYYAEGMLALHGGKVEDFDGVFDLPDGVVEILKEMGYTCDWRD